DGRSMATSTSPGCARKGIDYDMHVRKGDEVKHDVLHTAKQLAKHSEELTEQKPEPKSATEHAENIYTDGWASTGYKEEADDRLHAQKAVLASVMDGTK